MRALLSLIVAIIITMGTSHVASATGLVNFTKTPDIVPGQRGVMELYLMNTFSANMTNISLLMHIYAFATQHGVVPISSIPPENRPHFADGGESFWFNYSELAPSEKLYINVTIMTAPATAHGSFFSQDIYEMSSILSFHVGNTGYRFASPGVFNSTEWHHLLYMENGAEYLNYTLLNSLGYSGIIPDTSFGVNTPSPLYLIYVSASLSMLFALIAFIYYRRSKQGPQQRR
jgi:hypothetical protein